MYIKVAQPVKRHLFRPSWQRRGQSHVLLARLSNTLSLSYLLSYSQCLVISLYFYINCSDYILGCVTVFCILLDRERMVATGITDLGAVHTDESERLGSGFIMRETDLFKIKIKTTTN